MEERDFFDERQEKKPANLNCPSCHQSDTYEVTWVVRTKKRQLSGPRPLRQGQVLHAPQRRHDGLQECALPQAF